MQFSCSRNKNRNEAVMFYVTLLHSVLIVGLLSFVRFAEAQVPDSSSNGSENTIQSRIEIQGAILKTIESTELAAHVAGVVQALDVHEGDSVEIGQSLGRLQDESVKLKLEQLKSQVEMLKEKQSNDIDQRLAEKGKAVAENEYQRALNANARVPDTYPRNEMDRLKLVADEAGLELERATYLRGMVKYDVESAISEYKQTYELFKRHQITAPMNGIVVSVEKRAGEWVEPGAALLKIVRIDRLRVEGFVRIEQSLGELVGRSAKVQVETGEQTHAFDGTVTFVSPDANPVNSQVRVFLEVDNSERKIRPGLRVTAVINTES